MPIDSIVTGLALGALFGALAGLAAPRPGPGCQRSWPVTESVARDLDAARRILDSLAEQLNEARRAALNLETHDLPTQVCQAALDRAGIEETDLPRLTATLQALITQAGAGPASGSEETN